MLPFKGVQWRELFDRLVLERPAASLAFLLALLAFCGWGLPHFRLDASGDDLMLEHDTDLRYQRKLSARYGGGNFVVITYTPVEDLFSAQSLSRLKRIREELKALERVSSVVTPLDVPLLRNKPGPLKDLKHNIRTLESKDVDMARAIDEFKTSPIYQKLVVSEDLRSAIIQVNFKDDTSHDALITRRSELKEKSYVDKLTEEERAELKRLDARYRVIQDKERAQGHQDIARIRGIIAAYKGQGQFILGGVPMILDDILTFIRKDLIVFGTGMIVLLIATLYVIFRRVLWVVLPLLCCLASVLAMMGLLGWMRMDVTVVSSNFTSLQLILTLALAVHLVGHYNELLALKPDAPNRELVKEAVGVVFIPALHCQLTTVVGFASLIACDIVPIVNFGWMMSVGLVVSLINIFLILPVGMMLLPKPPPVTQEMQFGHGFTMACAGFVARSSRLILTVAAALSLVIAFGCMNLEVENSFINYFKKSTEIYRGMKFIDQKLGGTTPLDVTIDFPKPEAAAAPAGAPGDSDFEMFEDVQEEKDPSKYFFTPARLELIEKAHDYLDALPETGKVLSLATVWKQARILNNGKPLDDFETALLFNSLQGGNGDILVKPFVDLESSQVRINTRIEDSLPDLRRDALIKKIRQDLRTEVGLKEGQYRVAGLMVLYNNMLQSLYRSQITTVAWTLLPLGVMFFLLFRSLKVALVALVPSIIATTSVLGFLGLTGIPLDMMTITVVAVGLGIAVDNATHYIHRFRHEVAIDGDYLAAMKRCHATIGHNMVYSALPVILGFSILVLSNFVPTILFGVLVALAMSIALTSDLNLLPSIILAFQPFGTPEELRAKRSALGAS